MVFQAIFDVFFGVANTILTLLPSISWNVNDGAIDSFFDILGSVCYLLPMGTVVSVIGVIVLLNIFKIIISLLKTLWDIIPIL